jgi:hypothetical protein
LVGGSETHRDLAFCAHAILDDQILEVTDATQDSRFLANSLVTSDPNFAFMQMHQLPCQKALTLAAYSCSAHALQADIYGGLHGILFSK